MKAIMKLTVAALGAASIVGGVAVAQTSTDGRDQTANQSLSPGSNLKRDGSLNADQANTAATGTDASGSTTTTTSTMHRHHRHSTAATTDTSSATGSSSAADMSGGTATTADSGLRPRADRN